MYMYLLVDLRLLITNIHITISTTMIIPMTTTAAMTIPTIACTFKFTVLLSVDNTVVIVVLSVDNTAETLIRYDCDYIIYYYIIEFGILYSKVVYSAWSARIF